MFNRPMYYILDEQGNPVPSNDSHAAYDLLINADKRRIGRTEKYVAGHSILVSTFFLVIDHNYTDGPPILYETMVFINGSEMNGGTHRYETREQALEGHDDVCHDVEYVCSLIEQGQIEWSNMGMKLKQQQGLREIAQLSQEAGEYD